MTSSHFLYIPAVVLVGIILGFILGGRFAQDRINLERRRDEERAAAKAERASRKAARDKAAAEQVGAADTADESAAKDDSKII